jgi:hypothetical protein
MVRRTRVDAVLLRQPVLLSKIQEIWGQHYSHAVESPRPHRRKAFRAQRNRTETRGTNGYVIPQLTFQISLYAALMQEDQMWMQLAQTRMVRISRNFALQSNADVRHAERSDPAEQYDEPEHAACRPQHSCCGDRWNSCGRTAILLTTSPTRRHICRLCL